MTRLTEMMVFRGRNRQHESKDEGLQEADNET